MKKMVSLFKDFDCFESTVLNSIRHAEPTVIDSFTDRCWGNCSQYLCLFEWKCNLNANIPTMTWNLQILSSAYTITFSIILLCLISRNALNVELIILSGHQSHMEFGSVWNVQASTGVWVFISRLCAQSPWTNGRMWN